eukprot:4209322-Prymnesium_polylepis.3
MARLQVDAQAHCLANLDCESLWLVRPGQGVEINEHVVAIGHIVNDFEQRIATCVAPCKSIEYAFMLLRAARDTRLVLTLRPDAPASSSCELVLLLDELVLLLEALSTRMAAFNSAASSLAPGLCGLQYTLTVATAHQNQRVVLERSNSRPFERRLLEEHVASLRGTWHLDFCYAPIVSPLGELLLKLPRSDPLVGNNLTNHCLREHTVHLRVGQQQCDRLLANERAGELLDTIDLFKVDGHREDDNAPRLVDLLGARAAGEIFDVETDAYTRADLAAALLDELANVLPEWPGVRQEEVEARRLFQTGKVGELLFGDGG